MKYLFTLLLLLLSFIGFTQIITYDTVVTGTGTGSSTPWNMRVTYDPNRLDSAAGIIFVVGLGEMNTNPANMQKNGPHSKPGGGCYAQDVPLANGVQHPIVITLQPPAAAFAYPDWLQTKVLAILGRYRIKRNSLTITGLSQGGYASLWQACYQKTLGNYTTMARFAGVVAVQAVPPDDATGSTAAAQTPAYVGRMTYFCNNGNQGIGGKMALFQQKFDGRGIFTQRDAINAVRPGYAWAEETNYGNGGHNNFDKWYGGLDVASNTYHSPIDTFSIFGVQQNIYQWMLRQGDTVSTLGPQGPNVPPTARAGSDQTITLPTSSVTLNGSASSDDHFIVAYQWTKLTGTGGTITSPTNSITTFTGLTAGTYTVELTVTDDSSATGKDTIMITVNAAAPTPPTVSAGADQSITLPTSYTTLVGTDSPPAGATITGRQWTEISGPNSPTFGSATSATTTVGATGTALVQGTYKFSYTVTASNGTSASDSMVLTVNSTAGGNKFVRVNIYGGTNPYSNSAWNNWNVGTGTSPTPSGTFNYDDGSGSSGISATLASQQTIADNGPSFGGVIAPDTVLRYASYSTVSRNLVISGLDNAKTYNFQFFSSRANTGNTTRYTINGNVVALSSDNNITNAASYINISPTAGAVTANVTTHAGTYNYLNGFVITENNSTGGGNADPVANAGPDQSIDLPANSVILDGTGSTDSDGSIVSYQWSKIAGPSTFTITSPTTAITTVTGLVQGAYTFSLLVTDNLGGTSAESVNINVTNNPINQPPTVNAGPDKLISLADNNTTLFGTAADDLGVATYQWSITKTPNWNKTNYRGGFLTSSTLSPVGSGATTPDSSAFGRFKHQYQTDLQMVDSLYNFGAPGLYVYEAMPSSYTPPAGRPTPAVGRNTTAMVTRNPKPKFCVVSFPSNGYDQYSIAEVMFCFRTIKDSLEAAGIATYICTTQPRPQFDATGQNNLRILHDSIVAEFPGRYIDIWKALTEQGTDDMLAEYSDGSGIHINNAGHKQFYELLVYNNVFKDSISSSATLNTPTIASTAITNIPQGTTKFQLSVTDVRGLSANDFADVTVDPTVAQNYQTVYCGEYQTFIKDVNNNLFGLSVGASAVGAGVSEGIAVPPLRVFLPEGLTTVDASSGLHHSLLCDNTGRVWTWGFNEVGQSGTGTSSSTEIYTPVRIETDTLGNAFTGIIDVETGYSANAYSYSLALKNDGTVWGWGLLKGGLLGNGTNGDTCKRPIQIAIPGGRLVSKILGGEIIMVLCTDSTVWSWGGDGSRYQNLGTGLNTSSSYKSPNQVSGLPSNIRDIAGAGQFSYALTTDGKPYGWGYYGCYLGYGTGGYDANTPVATAIDLSTLLGLPQPVTKIVTNSVTTHVILANGGLWGWGDNAVGSIGNGEELNFSTYTIDPAPTGGTPAPYNWDLGPGELMQQTPVHILSQYSDFVNIYGGSSYVFYKYAQRSSGQLYSWGRNKTGVLGNGVIGPNSSIIATYPNSWDVPQATAVNPLGLTSYNILTSPYCNANPSGSPCNTAPVDKTRKKGVSYKNNP